MTTRLHDAAPSQPPKPKGTFYTVPAGTRPSKCKGAAMGGTCTATIYFITNPNTGRPMPVSCDVEGGVRPSESADASQLDMLAGGVADVRDGRGVSHFTDCPDADDFSRGAR